MAAGCWVRFFFYSITLLFYLEVNNFVLCASQSVENDFDSWKRDSATSEFANSASDTSNAARQVADRGVFARWREDLQGRKRADSDYKQVSVFTTLGKIFGFTVQLYDLPELSPHLRPANYPEELQKSKRDVSVFLGIPYAQAPTKEARFKPPLAHPGWQSWLASEYQAACPQPERFTVQLGRRVHEDCLYLNVFSPSVSSTVSKLYSVILHVHGGGFYHGASDNFPGHMLAAWGEVVVVTFNYRLGALGFLSTADEHIPGNLGLLDQAMALEWVHQHIRHFNGDPGRITVMGTEAGAAAAGALAVAPSTAPMVHQVIAHSGSLLADWAVTGDLTRLRNTSRVFAASIGCPADSSSKLLHCLTHSRMAREIGSVELQPDVGWAAWTAVIDGWVQLPTNSWDGRWKRSSWRLLTDSPEALFRSRQLQLSRSLRLLTGVSCDPTSASPLLYYNRSTTDRTGQMTSQMTSQMMDAAVANWVDQHNYTLNRQAAIDAIRYRYTYWPAPKDRQWISRMHTEMLSDALYTAPMDKLVKLATKLGVKTFQYVLNSTAGAVRDPRWRQTPADILYYYISGAPFIDQEFYPVTYRVDQTLWTEHDRNMSQFFIDAFANFAKFGQPTPRRLLDENIYWQSSVSESSSTALRYLSINGTFNSSMHFNYRPWQSGFWNQYLPTVVSDPHKQLVPVLASWMSPERLYYMLFWLVTCLCSLLLVLLLLFCCMWFKAKRRGDRLYEETYMENATGLRENSHFANKPSYSASLASMSELNGQSGVGGVTQQFGGPAGAIGLYRADARSVARDIRADRRRMSSRDMLVSAAGSEFSFRGDDSTLRRGSESRMSTRSGLTAPYATLEHTAPLASVAPRAPGARHPGMANFPCSTSTADRVQHAKSIPNVLQDDDELPLTARVRARSTDLLLQNEPGHQRPAAPLPSHDVIKTAPSHLPTYVANPTAVPSHHVVNSESIPSQPVASIAPLPPHQVANSVPISSHRVADTASVSSHQVVDIAPLPSHHAAHTAPVPSHHAASAAPVHHQHTANPVTPHYVSNPIAQPRRAGGSNIQPHQAQIVVQMKSRLPAVNDPNADPGVPDPPGLMHTPETAL